MSSLEKFLSSRAGKRFYNFAYCWGACLVILGAVFKIAHFPYDNVFLMIGLVTEVTIFFISGFDEPAREYKWERIFPDLNKKGATGTAVPSVSVDGVLSERYTQEMKLLEENARKLNAAYEQQLKETVACCGKLNPETLTELDRGMTQLIDNITRLNQKYTRLLQAMNADNKD